ncbi:FHA domain-containing protein [Actinomadura sp. ATCC 31491]|uniref:FHA domain-containing protein n=1 Tax=Actinomadura luzonensis TaxID=2805427 RepID=A0ABT0FVS1_9ACTN|nr:FHA domain-containing protein [Actinomadura luzonensis]MCK2216428.1 FHA domain-containing protein [Actinomadura luzonensis]
MTGQGFAVVRPLPGNGLVAYLGGLLLVCDPGEATADGLLDALRETAASGGDGRALARRAAQVLAANMAGDPAACAVAGPVTGGVAVLVSGPASASVVTSAGETRLSGSDSLTWADRLVTGTVERVELSLPGAGVPHPAVRFDGGVVHGGGLVSDLTDQSADRPVAQPSAQPAAQPAAQRDERPAAPAPSRPLTSEMPATAFHIEADLIPPPAERPQQQPVERPPYPLADQPPAAPSPPSGPQPVPAALDQPYHTPQDQPFPGQEHHSPYGSPQDQAPYHQPQEQPPSPPEPQQYPSYDEQPPSGNGLPDQQAPQHLGAPDHFGDQPSPFGQPDPFDHPGQQQPPPQQEQQQEQGDRPLVYGVDCKNDHFNDPRVPYCAVCGIALVQRTLVPYKGPRPSLGVLILDDGTALPLETDYLLGRDPERAPEVAGGTARPAKVTSPDGSVSRRHLRVALDGWDVNLVDLGSVNGTQIQPPGDPNFYDIPPNEPVTIAPGTTVRVGVSRTLRYEAHRG